MTTDKLTTHQNKMTVKDYLALVWTFAQHNTSEANSFQSDDFRVVCTCDPCEMLRRITIDDFSIFPCLTSTIRIQQCSDEGEGHVHTLEEYQQYVLDHWNDLG